MCVQFASLFLLVAVLVALFSLVTPNLVLAQRQPLDCRSLSLPAGTQYFIQDPVVEGEVFQIVGNFNIEDSLVRVSIQDSTEQLDCRPIVAHDPNLCGNQPPILNLAASERQTGPVWGEIFFDNGVQNYTCSFAVEVLPNVDKDNDGVPEDEDRCPNAAGPAENDGCPNPVVPNPNLPPGGDADGDGVINSLDACPNLKGEAPLGCPQGQPGFEFDEKKGVTTAILDQLNPLKRSQGVDDDLRKPGGIISRVLTFAFPLAGLILLVTVLWGGFEILSQSATQKSIDAGRQRITAGIIGFILLFSSIWIIQIVSQVFGISIL